MLQCNPEGRLHCPCRDKNRLAGKGCDDFGSERAEVASGERNRTKIQ